MPDNVQKALNDAVAESDNQIGGQIQTRLRQKAKWGRNDCSLAVANPTRISAPTGSGWFEAWMVGLEIDILAKLVPTGQEGRYTVLTVDASGDWCTVQILGGGAPAFVDETPVQIRLATLLVETAFEFLDPSTHITDTIGSLWVGLESTRVTYGAVQVIAGDMEFQQLGNPDTGVGYLTRDHKPRTEITEASQSYSALDHLRRAMIVSGAVAEELDRVARNLAVIRPLGLSDSVFREVIKVLAYLPKGTTYGLEMLLDALFPAGGWSIYEDRINFNNTVFILLPTMEPGTDFEGRGFLDSEEDQTATGVTTVTADHTPISVYSITLANIDLSLLMAVLPSADPVPWTYVNEGDIEGNIFTLLTGKLVQTLAAGTVNGGRYSISIPELGIALPPVYGAREVLWSFAVDFQLDTVVATGGRPFMLTTTDGVREYTLMWDETDLALGQSDGTVIVSGGAVPAVGSWGRFELRRRGDVIEALIDGKLQLAEDVGSFAADATTVFSFGYWNNALNQDWNVWWDNAACVAASRWRNFWNLYRQTGALSAADADLDDAGNPFVAGDDGKYVRVHAVEPENDGLWLGAFVAAGTLTLDGVPRGRARVYTPDPTTPAESFVVLEEAWFTPQDAAKEINISGSALGNDGDYPAVAYGSPTSLMVDASALPTGFTTENLLTWKFNPVFAAEANVQYEVVDAGTRVGAALTLHASEAGWPVAAQEVIVGYTSVLSMQLMRDETVENEGNGGTAGNVYYPFYLWDVEQGIQDLMDEVTAAGVIPEFERSW